MTSALIDADASPRARGPVRSAASALPGSRTAHGDARWSRIIAALEDLRARKRRAVRIVDADCACGTLLIAAARHARALGFTAIEGRGIDGSPSMVGRARAASARLRDPAIGLAFDVTDMAAALAEEAAFPADIVLWHGRRGEDRMDAAAAVAAAGTLVIGDPAAVDGRRAA